jgi:hypothetical protein
VDDDEDDVPERAGGDINEVLKKQLFLATGSGLTTVISILILLVADLFPLISSSKAAILLA